jgi:putative lipoprotein
MTKPIARYAAALLVLGTAACTTTAAEPPARGETVTVAGSASYRERIALVPGAAMSVRVEDVSRADAPARIIGEHSFVIGDRQVPLPFAVEVPRASLLAAHRTSVRVRIEGADGTLLWTTDTNYPVETDPAGDRVDVGELRLVRVGG